MKSIVDKIGDEGDSGEKVKKLEEGGFITGPEGKLLKAVIEAGNASAHRGYAPDPNDLKQVMDILEAILEKLYVEEGRRKKLDEKAAALKAKVPPRKPNLYPARLRGPSVVGPAIRRQ